MMNSGIYVITNTHNGKRYVGSAANLELRRKTHFKGLRKGNHHNKHLQRAFEKHGEEAFAFSVLELCAPEILIEREQSFIDSTRPEYNLSPTAWSILGFRFKRSTDYKPTPEHAERIGAAHRGMKRSEETRAKIAAAKVGKKRKPYSNETRAKLSAALKGKQKTPEHMAKLQEGRAKRIYTEEQRKRISEASIALWAQRRATGGIHAQAN